MAQKLYLSKAPKYGKYYLTDSRIVNHWTPLKQKFPIDNSKKIIPNNYLGARSHFKKISKFVRVLLQKMNY